MTVLDNQQKTLEISKSPVYESISLFPDQIKQAWDEMMKLKLPKDFKKIKEMIVAGMGGSALGARMIDSLNFEVLEVPLEIVSGYHLPAYVDKDTLVIISSYSGNTEETISCFEEASKRKSKIFVITGGGELAKLAKNKKIPVYTFRDRYNPSKQPRLGLGYSITAEIALLSKLKLIRADEAQISEAINYLEEIRPKLSVNSLLKENRAKKIAESLKNQIVVVVSSEHLNGAAHTFKNMFNESSKNFAVRFSLPELNHHLLEGLSFPKENKKVLKILFLESDFYDPEIKKRIRVTKEVIEKNEISYDSLKLQGRTRLVQTYETIYIGSFVSYYLALLNETDPAEIPWVDYFKKKLKE